MLNRIKSSQGLQVFALIWSITFILYFPAAKAGWVIDAAGWLYDIRHHTFWDYINRTQSKIASLYQFTQLTTYVLYKIIGANVWAWSLLFITMHTVNAWLVFTVSHNILKDTGVQNARKIALAGLILFLVSPHISEVLIWKACYHYLQGLMLLMLCVYWAQRYIYEQKTKYIWGSGILFACSVFSLEIFYLTPFFIATLAMYYRFVLGGDKELFRKILFRFLLPQVLMLLLYIVLFNKYYSGMKPHVYNLLSQTINDYLSKPPKYFFHIFFLGRYFSYETRLWVYALCRMTLFLIIFYTVLIDIFVYFILNINRLGSTRRALFLFYTWVCLTIAILAPIPFPDGSLLVFMDRYIYFSGGFVYIFVALLLSDWVKKTNSYYRILFYFGLINIFFTVMLNMYWKKSAYINNRLLHEFPAPGNKTMLLLNIPENLQGVPMIGSQHGGEFKAMRELFIDSSLKNPVYDVLSYNLLSGADGVHVVVKNDSTLRVVPNQFGNWWWYEGHGATSYENEEYKVKVLQNYNAYELTLKHPAENYMLLYEVDGCWRQVKWVVDPTDSIYIHEFGVDSLKMADTVLDKEE